MHGKLPNSFWNRIKRNALVRDIEFNIKIQEGWKIYKEQKGKCALSGCDIFFPRPGQLKTDKKATASLDRIDSSKPYTPDNVQWVHKIINIMKGSLPDKDFINWCNMISTNRHTQSGQGEIIPFDPIDWIAAQKYDQRIANLSERLTKLLEKASRALSLLQKEADITRLNTSSCKFPEQ